MSLAVARSRGDDVRWYRAPKDDVHMQVTSLVRRIRDRQGLREEMNLHHARLYGNMEISGFSPNAYWKTPSGYEPTTLAWNVVREVCDTVHAKLSKNRPLPMFLTAGGNYAQQKKARDLGRFIEGEFERCKVWQLFGQQVLDTCVFGTGLLTVYRRGNRVVVERVLPWELIVDAVEAQHGAPRSIYQMRWVDKDLLTSRFPRLKDEIEGAHGDEVRGGAYESTNDLVLVIEAWRLPDDNGKGGRHVAVISNATLVDEPWEKDYFPFVALRKSPPIMGWWGVGFAEELAGLQWELNFTTMRIQKGMRVMGGALWMVDSASEVVSSHLTNDAGVIVKYKGRQPTAVTPQPVHPMQLEYARDLRAGALPTSGVSSLSARSEKPAGVTAAIALETLNDTESERFMPFYRAQEECAIELARQMIEVAKEISEDDPDYEVRAIGKRKLRIVKFEDVNLDRDSYVMRVFPTSMLAKTPSARLQQVTDWTNIGWLTPTEAKMLMDFPDLDRVRQLATSSYELVEEILERLQDGDPNDPDTFVSPEPQMDLSEAMRLCQLTYLRAKLDGVPEENLELLRRWYDQAKMLSDQAKAPAANDNTAPGLASTGTEGMGPPPPPNAAPPGATPASPPPGAPIPIGNA